MSLLILTCSQRQQQISQEEFCSLFVGILRVEIRKSRIVFKENGFYITTRLEAIRIRLKRFESCTILHSTTNTFEAMDVLRDSTFGTLVRVLSQGKLLQSSFQPKKESLNNVAAQMNDDDAIIVDWNGPDDPQNPQNWSDSKRYAIGLLIW